MAIVARTAHVTETALRKWRGARPTRSRLTGDGGAEDSRAQRDLEARQAKNLQNHGSSEGYWHELLLFRLSLENWIIDLGAGT